MKRKLIAAILTFIFAFGSASIDATAFAEIANLSPRVTTNITSGLDHSMCEMDEAWTSSTASALVILLQEAHLNIQSQKNIIATLEYFHKEFIRTGISDPINIALEGHVPGEINPVLFRAFPLPEITREVSDSFMRAGKIDGAEFYAINSNKKARLFGIDDPLIYQKNLDAYRRFRKDQEIFLEGFSRIQRELNVLKDRIFSKPLRDLRESSRLVEKNPANLVLHLAKLEKLAKLKQIDLGDFPRILKNKEKIESIRAGLFFDQLSELEWTLSRSLARSEDEETLVAADRFVTLLNKLASLSLTHKEDQELLRHLAQIRSASFWRSVDDLMERQKQPIRISGQIAELLTLLEPAFQYYVYARQRDLAMANNIEALTRKPGQKILFVVAGGFHTRGLTELFREKKISYFTMVPKPGLSEDSSRYWNLLAETVKPRTEPNNPEVSRTLIQRTAASSLDTVIETYVRNLKTYKSNPEIRESLEVLESIQANSLGAEHLIPAIDDAIRGVFERRKDPFANNPALDQELKLLNALKDFVNSQFAMIKVALIKQGYFQFLFGNNLFLIALQQRSPGMKPEIVISTHQQKPADPDKETIASMRQNRAQSPAAQPVPAPAASPNDPNARIAARLASVISETTGRPKFTNVHFLAGGGMGKVFRAIDENGKPIAIKVFADAVMDIEGLERFKRESEAMSKFDDPRFIKVFGTGKIETGTAGFFPYFVMELIEGGNDLNTLIKASPHGRVPFELAVPLIAQSAQALHSMHELGFRHRDIKPANIMLRPWWSSGEIEGIPPVKVDFEELKGQFISAVADFGLVRMPGKETLTQSGVIMGTPVFMSPEQAGGEKKLGAEADIYSLGASLYQMLTGQMLIAGKSPVAIFTTILDKKQFNENITKALDVIDQLGLPAAKAKELKRVIKKSVEHDAKDRYSTAELFAEDLKNLIENRKVSSRTQKALSGSQRALSQSQAGARRSQERQNTHSDEIPAYTPAPARPSKTFPAVFLSVLAAIPVTLGIIFWKKPGDSQPVKTQIEVRDPVTERLPVPLNVPPPQTSAVTLPAPSAPVEEIITLSGNTSSEKIDDGIRRMTQKLSGNTPDYAGAVKVFGKIMDLHEFLTASQREVLTRLTNQIFDNLFADQNKPGILINNLIDKMRIFHSNAGERGHFFRAIAHRFEFPGPNRDFDKARELFSSSALLLAESYRQTNNLRDLIFKAISETKSGQFEESNRTLTTVKQLIQPGQGSFDTGILDVLAAQNYFGLGQYRAARDYFGTIDPATGSFIFKPEFQSKAEDSVKLNFKQVILNSYTLDLATRYAEYRTLFNSGANQVRMGQVREEIRTLIEESQKYMDPLEREMLSILRTTPNNAPVDELKRFHVAYTNILDIALFYEAQASDPSNSEAARQALEAADQRYRLLNSVNVPPGVASAVSSFAWHVRLMLENNSDLRNISIPAPAKQDEVTAAGLKHLSRIVIERRMRIRGEIPQERCFLSQETLQETLNLLLREEPNTTLARLWGSEILATGRSLGNSKNIFDSIRIERNLSPIIMEFNAEALKELAGHSRKLNDPRQSNPSAPLIMLMANQKEIRAASRPYGGTERLWQEHRIGLVEWKMNLAKTKKASLEKNLIKRIMARYGISIQDTYSLGFLGDSFKEDWGTGVLRIKYDSARFKEDANYRAASLGSAFYALNHKGEWKDLFDFNSGDNTYSLTSRVLNELLKSWKSLKSFLISA